MAYLEQSPDHHRFEARADAARRHDESVGRYHELVEARKKRSVLKCHSHESIDILLEQKVHEDPDRLGPFRRSGGSLVGRLHPTFEH